MRTDADKLLAMLYDADGQYVPAEPLGKAVADPPAAAGELARRSGTRLEVREDGAMRLGRPAPLAGWLIERDLGTDRVGRDVICFEQVSSTNDVAFDAARGRDADGLVVLADSQRSGRGRFGRVWVSPPRANVLMSVVLLDPGERLAGDALTIAGGVAVAEGLDEAFGTLSQLRWPNDVLLADRKVAGVLVEVRRVSGRRTVVVGVGVNVSASPPDDRVDHPATDLCQRLGRPIERVETARAVLRSLDRWVARVAGGRLAELADAWTRRCGMMHQRVHVRSGGQSYVGRVLDVHPTEGLVLQCDDGRRLHVPAAGASLREDV
jgi:BirA family biotin operon repressor/biotin-[acetyl-CoA-carboxylase] ligase